MRKYIDCIRLTNSHLAYTLVEALERDGDYSVDLYDQSGNAPRRNEDRCEIELRIYHNEKITPAPAIGFGEGEKTDEN